MRASSVRAWRFFAARRESGVAYWWASQNKNYKTAIEQGTLWSCETSKGLRRRDRIALHDLEIGDYVFHYAHSRIRAVSQVTEPWIDAPRPPGYPKVRAEDLDIGWLVRVEPIDTKLNISWQRAAELIEIGHGGPLNVRGVPAQKYLSPLSDDDGAVLLVEAGVIADDSEESFFGLPAASWGGDSTDAETVVRVRMEQRQLRDYLLGKRRLAPCDICGRTLPKQLLVAAHIVPRSMTSEEDRKEFSSIAMLACALGCDVLFEWGYIVIDGSGLVRPGVKCPTPELQAAIELLDGRRCTAHTPETARRFADHARIKLDGIQPASPL